MLPTTNWGEQLNAARSYQFSWHRKAFKTLRLANRHNIKHDSAQLPRPGTNHDPEDITRTKGCKTKNQPQAHASYVFWASMCVESLCVLSHYVCWALMCAEPFCWALMCVEPLCWAPYMGGTFMCVETLCAFSPKVCWALRGVALLGVLSPYVCWTLLGVEPLCCLCPYVCTLRPTSPQNQSKTPRQPERRNEKTTKRRTKKQQNNKATNEETTKRHSPSVNLS